MRKRSKHYKKAKIRLILICFLLLACVTVFLIDMQVRPLIRSAAQERAKIVATRLINDAVAKLIEQDDVTYSNIIQVILDENSNVKSIESDIIKLNRFKADVNCAVIDAVSGYDNGSFGIRLGSLIGNEFFIGRGPMLTFKFDMVNTVTSEFSDSFVAAGINQTKHRIMLCIDTKINILIPWYNTSVNFKTEVMVAETIIVGSVPNSYATIDLNGGTLNEFAKSGS